MENQEGLLRSLSYVPGSPQTPEEIEAHNVVTKRWEELLLSPPTPTEKKR